MCQDGTDVCLATRQDPAVDDDASAAGEIRLSLPVQPASERSGGATRNCQGYPFECAARDVREAGQVLGAHLPCSVRVSEQCLDDMPQTFCLRYMASR